MGWKIRALLLILTALLVSFLFLSVAMLLAPEFETPAYFLVGIVGVNLFISLFALFKTNRRDR